jgi:chaperonin cofactor prefoldin
MVKEVSKYTGIWFGVFSIKIARLLQELDRLEDGAEVFKLIGPVLIKQELSEAKQNVQKRIDYISKEMWASQSN